jgi:hypothetical protein
MADSNRAPFADPGPVPGPGRGITPPDGEQGRSWPRNDLCGECGHWHDHTGRQLLAMRDWQGERYAIPKGHMPRNNADDAGGREYGDCPGEHPTDGEETSSGTSDLPANTEGRAVEGGASPSGPSLAEQLRQESLRADAFFRGREVAQARAEREKARADRAEAELARARSDVDAVLRGLTFRRERSRPVFRNKHTGTEVVVLDLAVDDRGGFQGGCRQFTVVTDEAGPPGYKTRGPYSLDSFVQHWEPTGEHVPVDSDRIRERLHGD